ncbi:MAG: ribonucleotide reductase N-terminal alpha domain-containing protein, partial [Candidatus Thorarchaeota archaeon]
MDLVLLDRYARKSLDSNTFGVGDLLLAYPNGATRLGKLVARDDKTGTIATESGATIVYPLHYFQKPLEFTLSDVAARVARDMAIDDKEYEEPFFDMISQKKFLPGGRILHAAGDTGRTYLNCFHLPPPKDSRGGIVGTLGEMIEVMSMGGGVGLGLSSLRPRNAPVRGVGGRSSGTVSWGELYSFATGLVEQGGSRRGALLLLLDDWHPALPEFIRAKRDNRSVNFANLSVAFSDEFMRCLEQDTIWAALFPDTSHPAYDSEWCGNLGEWSRAGLPVITY